MKLILSPEIHMEDLSKKTQLNYDKLDALPRIYSLTQTDKLKSAREIALDKQAERGLNSCTTSWNTNACIEY